MVYGHSLITPGRDELCHNFVNDNSTNLCLVLFHSDNSLSFLTDDGAYTPYGKKQMSDFYPEHEEFPHHRQDRAAIGRNPASEAVHKPTHERAVRDDRPSPSESGGSRRGRYMETEETPFPYRETDKGENIAYIAVTACPFYICHIPVIIIHAIPFCPNSV